MNGVFWTTPIPMSSIDINPGAGSASWHFKGTVSDFGTVVRSLMGEPPIGAASVQWTIDWSGVSNRLNITNTGLKTPFAGEFVQNTATMSWSASEPGSGDMVGATHTSGFAVIGHERNGVFFAEGD
jgi:hypothetical protein